MQQEVLDELIVGLDHRGGNSLMLAASWAGQVGSSCNLGLVAFEVPRSFEADSECKKAVQVRNCQLGALEGDTEGILALLQRGCKEQACWHQQQRVWGLLLGGFRDLYGRSSLSDLPEPLNLACSRCFSPLQFRLIS